MSEPSATAIGHAETAGAATPRTRSIKGVLQRAEAFAAHHGIWSLGVRLQRNLSLRMKVLMATALVGLPLCCFVIASAQNEWMAFRQSERRLASLNVMRDLSTLARTSAAVRREAMKTELELPSPELEAAQKADQLRFDAFTQAIDLAAWPASTAAAVELLKERRLVVLKHATNASKVALPGRGGPRIEALADYAHELTVLRAEVARASGITADAPSAVRALNEALGRSIPKLRWQLARLAEVGAPLYDSSDREPRSRRLTRFTTQAEVLLEGLESDVVHAMDQGLIDPTLVRAALPLARTHIERAQMLAVNALAATSAVELAVTAGFERAAYQHSGAAAIEALNTLEDAAFESFLAWTAERADGLQQHLILFVGLVGAWLLVAAYLLVCSYKVLAGGLKTLVMHLEALGRGDLAERAQGHGRDEIGRALTALAKSTSHMSQLFGAVTQGVAAVSQASREVAGGNAGLTNRSSSVQGLIAAVAERAQACSATLDTCGEQVEQTAELVQGMRADGQRGRKAVSGLREGMERLQGKSREIGQVVGLVEAMAYQTKLLSINASVEAARAGEAGRGFSVVAQEVRALAVRSERAAQRIAGIVSASIEEIETCGLMAERTDDAVQRNEQKMKGVDERMREAVRLTRTGRTDSQEVLTIARNVEESMGGNVRVVEQLASASASLRTQGDHLKRSLQHFIFG